MTRWLWLLVLTLLPLRALAFDPMQFIAYGDLPYSMAGKPVLVSDGRSDQEVFDQDIRPAIHDHAAPFVVHVGDLGRPETSCADADLKRHLGWWQGFGKPVFYTPGDNDWIDCIRKSVPGGPFAPLDRLASIRSLLFTDATLATYQKTPPGWAVRRGMGGVPENIAWTTTNPAVAFLSLHVVSSCNGRDMHGKQPCKISPEPGMDDGTVALIRDAKDRDTKNIIALTQAYAEAATRKRSVQVIIMQADMFGEPADDAKHPADIWDRCRAQTEFKPYCDILPDFARDFAGDTLLVHGDTGAYCLEQLPLEGSGKHRFWRLNVPGDFAEIDASVVSISQGADGQPVVAVKGLLSEQPAPPRCDRAQYTYRPAGSYPPAYPHKR